MRTLILSQKNVLPGTNNTVFEYNFPGGGIGLKPHSKIALASMTMYNSTPNISAANQNNRYQYRWIDGSVKDVIMPDGFYEISDMNNFLHQTMLNNYHYLTEVSTNNAVWFLTFSVNTSTYKIDLLSFPLIDTTYIVPGSYTNPSTGKGAGVEWTVPAVSANPQFVIPATLFDDVIGFAAGNYPALQTNTEITVSSSTFAPQVNPLSSYLVKCNLVNNPYGIPNSLIYSFPPSGSFGQQFVVAPNEYSFIDTQDGYYNTMRIEITDQNDRPTIILDSNINILVVITDRIKEDEKERMY
jgi:hypothetical protein